jgi:hypothetical protein
MLLVQSYAPDKAPYINCLEPSPSQLASTFESWFFLVLVRLNLGFILRETCRCARHTFLLGFPTGWRAPPITHGAWWTHTGRWSWLVSWWYRPQAFQGQYLDPCLEYRSAVDGSGDLWSMCSGACYGSIRLVCAFGSLLGDLVRPLVIIWWCVWGQGIGPQHIYHSIKYVGVAIVVTSVVTLVRSLYCPCKASLDNLNEKGCVPFYSHYLAYDPLYL